MELNTLGELMRDETQDAAFPGSDVEPLVAEALRRGRRTVVRQRVVAAVAGCALLIAGAAVAGQLPGRSVQMTPAAPTTTAARPEPAPTTTTARPEPAPTPTAERLESPPTVTEVLTFFQAHLPDEYSYSEISDDRAPMAGEVGVSFTLTGPTGLTWAGGGIHLEADDQPCRTAEGCVSTPLAGGRLRVMRAEDKGDGTWYYHERADGHSVWFFQDNEQRSSGRINRAKLPFSESEVKALLTAPGWDPLVTRCAAAGPAC
jgi:hypothetical protein